MPLQPTFLTLFSVPPAPAACDGGNPDAALGFIVEAGGIASLDDYPYKGADGFCQAGKFTPAARFKAS